MELGGWGDREDLGEVVRRETDQNILSENFFFQICGLMNRTVGFQENK